MKERERLSYWREAVCGAYVLLGCESNIRDSFHGEILLERYSRMAVSFVTSTSQEVLRRREDIARSTDEFFLLSLQMNNKGMVTQRGRSAVLQPGDSALYSSTDIYQLSFDGEFKQLVVQFPKKELLARLPNADLLTAQRLSGSNELGQLVGNNILHFSRMMGRSSELVQEYLQDIILDLITTALASLDDHTHELSLPDQHLLLRAKSYIHMNLSDPNLDRKSLAHAMGMSVRSLSAIFAGRGSSVAAYIRDTRLDTIAHNMLDDRFKRQSISEIALRWGFNNLQHFSRIFRNRFGVSPREYRTM